MDLYADDTTITSGKTVMDVEVKLQIVADDVGKWCNDNNMTISYTKSKVILVSTKKRASHIVSLELNIKIHVNSYKILGVTVDNNFTWKSHLENVFKSISRNLALLKGLIFFFLRDTKCFF